MRASTFITSYHQFPQLQAKILFHVDYWDGPRNGVCLVDGEKYWFDILVHWDDENECPRDEYGDVAWNFDKPWSKRFLVWKLSPEEIRYQEDRQEEFTKALSFGTMGKELDQFYKDHPPGKVEYPTAVKENVVGWFEY